MKFVSIMFTAEWTRSPLSGVQSHPIVAHTNLDGFCTLDVFGGRFDQQRFDCGILLLHDRPLMGVGWVGCQRLIGFLLDLCFWRFQSVAELAPNVFVTGLKLLVLGLTNVLFVIITI